MFQKNMLWPLQFAITTRHIQFQSIHLLLDTKQIFNENTFVTKMWHKHYTALGSSDLNWIPRSSKIGARQAVEDKSKTIYSRAVFVTACDLRLYQVYCFMPSSLGILFFHGLQHKMTISTYCIHRSLNLMPTIFTRYDSICGTIIV